MGEDTKHVLLGKDHPCVRSWIAGRSKQSEWVDDPVPLATITRAQSQALAAEEVANEIEDSKDGTCTRQLPLTQTKLYAKPIPKRRRKRDTQPPMACKPVDLVPDIEKLLTESEEVSISTSLPVEEDTHSKSASDDEVTEESFENCEAGNLQGLERGCLSEQPLPTLAKGKAEVLALTTQQKEDGMLNEMRCRADRQEDGYFYQGGVLVHSKLADPGREFTRVVVPSCRRKEILDAGHRGLAGGHFSHNKMVSMITQHFTWPGLRKDVREYCSTCPECQKAGRKLQPKVPMVVTPIISRPYERMSCDLVGPLQGTTTGYKYILTMICIGTRCPYASPLKKVDARTVADGILEVIQHTGIPKELLTDQGSVFTSRLNKELCALLGIDHIVTTAYHPQTNGMLERWHACLKGMLMKVQTDPKEWDRMLKYCLLAYRATPHSATGFSPYELIHGRNLRGPLEAMRSGWLENQITYSGTVE